MPRVTLRASDPAGGSEELLTEYICDWPDCPNIAEHMLGVVRELRIFVAVCGPHARQLAERRNRRHGGPGL
jgi:hypothetical protein